MKTRRNATVYTYCDDDQYYEVEKIVSHVSDEDGVLYLVRWKGYGPQADTWEREEAFMDTGFVQNYHQSLLLKKKRRKLSAKKPTVQTPVSDMSPVDTSTEDTATYNSPTQIIVAEYTPPDTPKHDLCLNELAEVEPSPMEEIAMVTEPIPVEKVKPEVIEDMATGESTSSVAEGGKKTEWTVMDIINDRRTHLGSKEYMVRWQKGTESYHSWEMEYNLNCWSLLWKYYANWSQFKRNVWSN